MVNDNAVLYYETVIVLSNFVVTQRGQETWKCFDTELLQKTLLLLNSVNLKGMEFST